MVKGTWYDASVEAAVPKQNIKAYFMQFILV